MNEWSLQTTALGGKVVYYNTQALCVIYLNFCPEINIWRLDLTDSVPLFKQRRSYNLPYFLKTLVLVS